MATTITLQKRAEATHGIERVPISKSARAREAFLATPRGQRRHDAREPVRAWARLAHVAIGEPQGVISTLMRQRSTWFSSCVSRTHTRCLTRKEARRLAKLARLPVPDEVLDACDAFHAAAARVGKPWPLPGTGAASKKQRLTRHPPSTADFQTRPAARLSKSAKAKQARLDSLGGQRRHAARERVRAWAMKAQAATGESQGAIAAKMGHPTTWFTGCVSPTKTGCLTRQQASQLAEMAKLRVPRVVLNACDAFYSAYSRADKLKATDGDTKRHRKAVLRRTLRETVSAWARQQVLNSPSPRSELLKRLGKDSKWLTVRTAPSTSEHFTLSELAAFARAVRVRLPSAIRDACKAFERARKADARGTFSGR